MELFIWKKEEPLSCGALVLCQGFYFVFISFENTTCILQNPFDPKKKIQVSLDQIEELKLTPWAEEVITFAKSKLDLPED